MNVAWVAGSVRARALARRRLGAAGVRMLAASPTLREALETLAVSPYSRDVRVDDTLAGAQHGVAAAVLWNLRVLAGWLPAPGARSLRLLAGGFEIANVDEHLHPLAGDSVDAPFRLGALATAWPRLASTTSAVEVREVLTASAWGDPGGHTPREIELALRTGWAQRVAAQVRVAEPWAAGGLALLVAREVLVAARPLPDRAVQSAAALLGRGAAGATSLATLRDRLPLSARWAVRGVEEPGDLWRAEARWWARLRSDGEALLARPRFGVEPALGTVALLAVDAWQVRAALEMAARGGLAVTTGGVAFDEGAFDEGAFDKGAFDEGAFDEVA